jgi:hypothetical protein
VTVSILTSINTDIPLKYIILSVILELLLSVRGVGPYQSAKLLNALLITSALKPTCLFITSVLNPFSELLSKYYSPIKTLENIVIFKIVRQRRP